MSGFVQCVRTHYEQQEGFSCLMLVRNAAFFVRLRGVHGDKKSALFITHSYLFLLLPPSEVIDYNVLAMNVTNGGLQAGTTNTVFMYVNNFERSYQHTYRSSRQNAYSNFVGLGRPLPGQSPFIAGLTSEGHYELAPDGECFLALSLCFWDRRDENLERKPLVKDIDENPFFNSDLPLLSLTRLADLIKSLLWEFMALNQLLYSIIFNRYHLDLSPWRRRRKIGDIEQTATQIVISIQDYDSAPGARQIPASLSSMRMKNWDSRCTFVPT
ncbi:MAG: hypothetical protein JOS17DRAFT_775303 [Linnemannia elongata]|nr:MAG: hypothetical protein JOS17DRAFT_775303 [Linnemannia elongata]